MSQSHPSNAQVQLQKPQRYDSRNGLVFVVRRGRGAPAIFKTWDEYKAATKGFSNPMFRKLPRALVERYLEFERDMSEYSISPVQVQARAYKEGYGRGIEGRGKWITHVHPTPRTLIG
jgi:hypothetical protein